MRVLPRDKEGVRPPARLGPAYNYLGIDFLDRRGSARRILRNSGLTERPPTGRARESRRGGEDRGGFTSLQARIQFAHLASGSI